MRDIIKDMKYDDLETDVNKYKKLMCYNCTFYENEHCSKKRAVRLCAKKGLKNRA